MSEKHIAGDRDLFFVVRGVSLKKKKQKRHLIFFERVLVRWANMSGRKKLWNGGSPKLGIFHALCKIPLNVPLNCIHSPYACSFWDCWKKANVFWNLIRQLHKWLFSAEWRMFYHCSHFSVLLESEEKGNFFLSEVVS